MRRILVTFCVMLFIVANITAQYEETVIVMDGKYVVKTKTPHVDNGIILAPVEETFQRMNAKISIDMDSQRVAIEKNNIRVTLTMNSRNADVNGKIVDMGATSKIIDGKMHVPVVPVSEQLKAYINRIPQKNATLIVTDFVRYADNIDKDDYTKMVNDAADAIIKKVITSGMNDYEKVYALAKHIETLAQYDYKGICKYNHRPYGVFIAGYAICNGYTEAMQMVLNKIGISNKIVHGSIINQHGKRGMHAWNLVTIDGNSFHLDITSNDDASEKRHENLYYFLSDDEIERSHAQHMIYNKERYPKCGPYSSVVHNTIAGYKKKTTSTISTTTTQDKNNESRVFLGELYNDGTGDSATINKGGNFIVISANKITENGSLVFETIEGSSPSPKLCGVTTDGKYVRLSTGISYGMSGVLIKGSDLHKEMKKKPYKDFIVIVNGDFDQHYPGKPYFYTKRKVKVKLFLQN